jgi:alkylation response protein AidB-like acyl-CoA dehydrogenase
MLEVNGLAVTAARRALLRLILAGNGRVYGEAGQVRVHQTYRQVTAEMKKLIAAEWVRALAPDEPRGPGETAAKGVTYYRLKDAGRVVLGLDKSSSSEEAEAS